MEVVVKADIRGVKYDGKVSVKSAADKTKVDVLIKKGSENVLQMSSEVQINGSKFRMRSKYSVMGGKVAQGDFSANQLKVGLVGDFELNPQSLLYKLVISKYRILTPFARRHSELEFFWDKRNKNVVLNKFYAKAKVDKDGSKVADVLISTNQQPYKFHVFLPAILGKLRPGMQEVD